MSDLQEAFDEGIRRYEAGEPVSELLPLFREIVEQQPKNGPALTCLAWLYLLNAEGEKAFKAAKGATRLAPADAQAYVNLALAMLETGKKGVREPVERVKQILPLDGQQAEEVRKNCAEGLRRKPGWQAMEKVQQWLFET